MCVKEFFGYNCGHCSVPYLRQCPLSQSNELFPVCEYPAERPIFTDAYCHPCARVVWNSKVLKEEEEHRIRHQQGGCECEFIFDAEERERRLRPRCGKGKGKTQDRGHSIALQNRGSKKRGGMRHVGLTENVSTESNNEQLIGDTRGDGHLASNMISPKTGNATIASSTVQNSSLNARSAAYEYVGHVTDEAAQGFTGGERASVMPESYEEQSMPQINHLTMGEVGSGMKWYLHDLMPALPAVAHRPFPLFVQSPQHSRSKLATTWQKAMSEPANGIEYQDSEGEGIMANENEDERQDVPEQPMVISSIMSTVEEDV